MPLAQCTGCLVALGLKVDRLPLLMSFIRSISFPGVAEAAAAAPPVVAAAPPAAAAVPKPGKRGRRPKGEVKVCSKKLCIWACERTYATSFACAQGRTVFRRHADSINVPALHALRTHDARACPGASPPGWQRAPSSPSCSAHGDAAGQPSAPLRISSFHVPASSWHAGYAPVQTSWCLA